MRDSTAGQGDPKPAPALRAVRLLNWVTLRVGIAALVTILPLVACLAVNASRDLTGVMLWLFFLLVVLAFLSALAWFLVVTFCFAQFSLRIFMTATALLACALLLIAGVNGDYIEFGVLAFAIALIYGVVVIHRFEPKG